MINISLVEIYIDLKKLLLIYELKSLIRIIYTAIFLHIRFASYTLIRRSTNDTKNRTKILCVRI